MNTRNKTYRVLAVLISLAALALITATAKNTEGFNAITVTFLYLLVVLAAAALTDRLCGLAVAVASGLLVNFYFLPPFGTFYIAAPEDWVAFAAYTATAVVVSHFSATVRRRAAEADRMQAQLLQFTRFTHSLTAVRNETLTPETLIRELRTAYELSYCAIYRFDGAGAEIILSSGTRPSQTSQHGEKPPDQPGPLLALIANEGPGVRCLSLKDPEKTVGALVISQRFLYPEVEDAIAGVVSLALRQNASGREPGHG